MARQSPLLSASGLDSGNRVFVYEVEGLRQNEQTENQNYPVRNSSTVLIRVPYSRMNDEMRRINRLGGRIVNIRSLADQEHAQEHASEE